MSNLYITPTHYTIYEGGKWKRWEGKSILLGDLNNIKFPKIFKTNQVAIPYDDKCLQHLHALAFDDPALGSGNFPRWDCINGWTTAPKGSLVKASENKT